MSPRLAIDGLADDTETRSVPVARPRAAPGEFTVTAVLAAALGLSSIASGTTSDGAPLVLAAATAFAVLVVGVVWPVVALRKVKVGANAPRDAIVGDAFGIDITVTGVRGYLELRTLDPPSEWRAVVGAEQGTVLHQAAERGVVSEIRVEVRSGAPLGVLVRRRVLRVRLPAPIFIAPRPVRVPWHPTVVSDEALRDSLTTASVAGGDTVRSVRDYVSGDSARLVHWPTTARSGSLVVREFEPAPRTGLAILVDLSNDAVAESAAAHAAGLARSVLAAGAGCWLSTATKSGPVLAPVATVRDINRRLAVAAAGPLAPAPPGWPVVTIREGFTRGARQ